ncbi:MAG: hypothetical protein BWX70_01245 [Verrucomicrobia bacterium ADurb.Bin070]|nr:MAG: hypothetical protein BWX70_01245 [Verrucomicrobia bacterium ADurb.Bin070]
MVVLVDVACRRGGKREHLVDADFLQWMVRPDKHGLRISLQRFGQPRFLFYIVFLKPDEIGEIAENDQVLGQETQFENVRPALWNMRG